MHHMNHPKNELHGKLEQFSYLTHKSTQKINKRKSNALHDTTSFAPFLYVSKTSSTRGMAMSWD